ncbi:hypothetical protein RFI_33823, partial [Reticulomyxa filosa]
NFLYMSQVFFKRFSTQTLKIALFQKCDAQLQKSEVASKKKIPTFETAKNKKIHRVIKKSKAFGVLFIFFLKKKKKWSLKTKQFKKKKKNKQTNKQKNENISDLKSVKGSKKVHLLLIGRSGSGKTTLRMAIRDYLLDKPFEEVISTVENEKKWYKDNKLEKPELSQAQTIMCITENFWNDEFDVHIIDTPGFSDPRGFEQDKKNFDSIAKYVDTLQFNAVLVVIPVTTNRNNKKLKAEISKLLKLLSDDHKRNFFVVFTFSTSKPDDDMLKVIQDLGLESCRYVYMHNSHYQSSFDLSTDSISGKIFFDNSRKAIRQLLTECSNFLLFQGFTFKNTHFRANRKKLALLKLRVERENRVLMINALQNELNRLIIEQSQKHQLFVDCWQLKNAKDNKKKKTDNIGECDIFSVPRIPLLLSGTSAILALGRVAKVTVKKIPLLGGVAVLATYCYFAEKFKCKKQCGHLPSQHVLTAEIPQKTHRIDLFTHLSFTNETQQVKSLIQKDILHLEHEKNNLDRKLNSFFF